MAEWRRWRDLFFNLPEAENGTEAALGMETSVALIRGYQTAHQRGEEILLMVEYAQAASAAAAITRALEENQYKEYTTWSVASSWSDLDFAPGEYTGPVPTRMQPQRIFEAPSSPSSTTSN